MDQERRLIETIPQRIDSDLILGLTVGEDGGEGNVYLDLVAPKEGGFINLMTMTPAVTLCL